MRIGNDISIFSTNQLSRTTSAIARSLQRLSSGLRVNSPQDDAAAFSEGVRLDSQIRGYTQAIRNINDASGLIQTATSAIDTQIDVVQKMRELAVQSSNGTLTSNDRANINTQIQSLYQEFSRITSSTQFNGINLLDGSFGTQNLQVGPNQADSYGLQIPSLQGSATFQKTIGTGSFKAATSFATGAGSSPYQHAIADINGDGILDLVAADFGTGMLSIFLGRGDGTFQTQRTVVAGVDPVSLDISDLNGDGVKDLSVADTNGQLLILLGNGDGTFKPAKTTPSVGFSSPIWIKTADLNHDGKLDIIDVDNTEYYASILLGNGDGTFQARKTLDAGTLGSMGAIGDVNNDGNPDLVIAPQGTHGLLVYLGNSDGTFQAKQTMSTGATYFPFSVRLADLNRDGKLDIISAVNNVSATGVVLLGNGDGTFQSVITVMSGNTAGAPDIAVADLNGDGTPDLVSANTDNTFSVLIGKGDGTFTTRTTSLAGGNAGYYLTLEDINGDGVPDIESPDFNLGYVDILLQNTVSTTAVSSLTIASSTDAQKLISILDAGLNRLKSDQAQLAGIHNRLDQSSSFSLVMTNNLSDAKSTALNVDLAEETSELVRNQILQQAGIAVLSQANMSNQLILKLFDSFGNND